MNHAFAETFRFRMGRRRWLALALAGLGGAASNAFGADRLESLTQREVNDVLAVARRTGLGGFRLVVSRRYLAMGDAPDAYQRDALKLCEAIAAEYFRHFAAKGFSLVAPSRPLTVVALADGASYARFSRDDRPAAYGQYDGRTNRLLIYDLRPRRESPTVRSDRLNRQVVTHEALHQLAFNSGLLIDPRGDHLRAIVEGLAVYGETYLPGRPETMGEVQRERVEYLAKRLRQGVKWLSAEALLADNSPFRDPSEANVCQAYAQSWVLVHHLMTDPALTSRFRSYLAAYARSEPDRRLEEARRRLGDLARLDQDARRRLDL